nr:hypothetical protein BaRGS_014582 [Batillaria attramentaria]
MFPALYGASETENGVSSMFPALYGASETENGVSSMFPALYGASETENGVSSVFTALYGARGRGRERRQHSDIESEAAGFHLSFSFHNMSALPQQLSGGKWNCSVPHWTNFRQHFLCTLESECAGGEDVVICPWHYSCLDLSDNQLTNVSIAHVAHLNNLRVLHLSRNPLSSLFSDDDSAFIICLITLDRFLVIRFTFSDVRFRKRSAHATCVVMWFLGLCLASAPLLPLASHWHFYGRTGICVPLPIASNGYQGHAYSFGVMIVLNFVLFLLIAVGQIVIYWSIQTNSMSTADSTRRSRDMAIARRLFAVVMSDFTCWFMGRRLLIVLVIIVVVVIIIVVNVVVVIIIIIITVVVVIIIIIITVVVVIIIIIITAVVVVLLLLIIIKNT